MIVIQFNFGGSFIGVIVLSTLTRQIWTIRYSCVPNLHAQLFLIIMKAKIRRTIIVLSLFYDVFKYALYNHHGNVFIECLRTCVSPI